MNQIDQIKELQRQGFGPKEIASRLKLDRKTAAKFMAQDEYSCALQTKASFPSKLDPFKSIIDGWLAEDRRMRFKQRHTAKRVHERLKEEFGEQYDCSYPLVQRYLKAVKLSRGEAGGFLELVWAAGEGQVDFGEADAIERGRLVTNKYLVLSFPSSNAAYVQAFGGETAECVAQGLKDIFHRIGGVPLRLVFDNASGVGRRVGEKVTFSEMFLRFKCHYGFSVSFCNPASGHEKGNVENKVGYIRRNFFVPIPQFDNLVDWNRELLDKSEADFARPHYKKPLSIADLFVDDRKALAPLPEKTFNVERHERVRTDGWGKFCLDGRHWYATAPELANQEVVVGVGAHAVTVYEKSGAILVAHRRVYGEARSDSSNYQTSLAALVRKPGAWPNSAVRQIIDENSRAAIDMLERDERKRLLSQLATTAEAVGLDATLASLAEAVKRGTLDEYSIRALAWRSAYEELGTGTATGPDLVAYDAFMAKGGES